jgi:hypothetical protein
VAQFQYPQNHSACKLTNQGFAFNEGWAEYWAHTLDSCGDGSNFAQEGNVATALDGLEKCADRPTMVRVLRENPGAIHSYAEFRTKFFNIVGPRACLVPPVAGLEAVEEPLSAAQLIRSVQAQIAAQKQVIVDLRRQRPRARRRAQEPGDCTLRRRCRPQVERLVEPFALDAKVAQARLVLGRLEAGLATARKQAFTPDFAHRKLYDRLDAERAAFERANQAIIIRGLKRSRRAIDADARFKPARSTAEYRRLDHRLALLTRARKRGASTPTAIESLFSAPSPPVDVARPVG